LIKAGLIDEFHLFFNPVAIGSGIAIFKDIRELQKFTLIKSTPLHIPNKHKKARKNCIQMRFFT
jgi:dihydrofolate reductase